ncbi:DUF998 domain-containing protein [Dactylosporangium sp. AC04546]|uniref:DUF998 domain-containing protein n=1 Tax=Dactylosporangium sp. AC04546 TaxID=2862460 RepID=UPI001EE13F5F|nr:DUF998 domain-containing protein [Dactylosporangium sp. AC04546]WVK86416.1 DUF998 domain-containing protein [Dactylosporangium sp. AC04546]
MLGSIVLIVNAVQWVVAEAVTAAAWTDPSYSYATNFISDLGVPDCGTQYQGRVICSPLRSLMNASFIGQGILFALGVVLLSRLTYGRRRRILVALALTHGVAFVLVGLFHGSPNGPDAGLVIHIAAAAVGILCANTVAILAGAWRDLGLPTAYRRFSIAVGVLGIASEALVNLSADTAGLFERGGVYSWLLWGLVTGALLVVKDRRGVAVGQNVAV